jgi:hypothetical protein
MTRAQALREARHILGPDANVTFDPGALDAVEKKRVLPLPPRPARSSPEWERWSKLADKRNALVIPCRCSVWVPVLGGAGRAIRGQGDTWEQAIAAIKRAS